MKTPWGLITAQYDLYTTGRRLQQHPAGCRKVLASGGDPLAQAARKLLQSAAPAPVSAVVPASGAGAPGLALPPNSTIPADYDADLTKLGACSWGVCWSGQMPLVGNGRLHVVMSTTGLVFLSRMGCPRTHRTT